MKYEELNEKAKTYARKDIRKFYDTDLNEDEIIEIISADEITFTEKGQIDQINTDI